MTRSNVIEQNAMTPGQFDLHCVSSARGLDDLPSGANRKIQIRPKEKVERWNPDHNLSRNRFSVSAVLDFFVNFVLQTFYFYQLWGRTD
jgi:hypothetical protein